MEVSCRLDNFLIGYFFAGTCFYFVFFSSSFLGLSSQLSFLPERGFSMSLFRSCLITVYRQREQRPVEIIYGGDFSSIFVYFGENCITVSLFFFMFSYATCPLSLNSCCLYFPLLLMFLSLVMVTPHFSGLAMFQRIPRI